MKIFKPILAILFLALIASAANVFSMDEGGSSATTTTTTKKNKTKRSRGKEKAVSSSSSSSAAAAVSTTSGGGAMSANGSSTDDLYNLYDRHSRQKSVMQVRREYGESQVRLEQVLAMAPARVKTIVKHIIDKNYLKRPEFRSVLFIGPKGVGKTTVAKAMAYKSGCKCYYLPYSVFKRPFRDQTSIAIREQLQKIITECQEQGVKAFIIIDEMNRLFENYDSSSHDSDSNASTFWLFIDEQISKLNEDFFLIGIMNRADKLPIQLQDRHMRGHIYFNELTGNQLRQVFLNEIEVANVQLDDSCSESAIGALLRNVKGWGARDLIELIAEAELIYKDSGAQGPVVLSIDHLKQARDKFVFAQKEIYKTGAKKETLEEQRERQFVQSHLINLVAGRHKSDSGGITEEGYNEIYHRYISDEQARLVEDYLEDTQKADDAEQAEQERKKQEQEQREKNDAGCVVQ